CRALGPAEIPIYRVTSRNAFIRLLEFSRPHRGRLIAALLAMAVYGGANVAVVRQLTPVVDDVLKKGESVVPTVLAILAFYFLKGTGAYLSDYLMTGVGQPVVRD